MLDRHMLRACLTAAALSPLALPASAASPDNLPDLIARLAPSGVQVTAVGPSAGGNPLLSETITTIVSGAVVSPDGFILTAATALTDGAKLTVTFDDGTSGPATFVGKDDLIDVGVIKVTPTAPLTPVTFGKSAGLRRGDFALAIGNAGGYGGVASVGIIAAVDAGVPDTATRYLQSSAGGYRGAVGGPLFDGDGNVIAIVARTLAPDVAPGLEFAVPADTVTAELAKLEQGSVAHGWLGVSIRDATTGEAANGGVMVAGVNAASPAAPAGIAADDVIVAIDGKAVARSADLADAVKALAPGAQIALDVVRGGWKKTVTVTLGDIAKQAAPDATTAAPAAGEPTPEDQTAPANQATPGGGTPYSDPLFDSSIPDLSAEPTPAK